MDWMLEIENDKRSEKFKACKYHVILPAYHPELRTIDVLKMDTLFEANFVVAQIDYTDDTSKIIIIKNRSGPDKLTFYGQTSNIPEGNIIREFINKTVLLMSMLLL